MEQQRQFTKLNFSETPDPRGQSAPDTPRLSEADAAADYLTQALADALYAALAHGHTSASISDFTEAAQDVIGAMVAAAGGSYNDGAGTIALPGGSGTSGLATITIPTARMEWEETVTAVGVTGTNRIMLTLAPAADTDENDPLMLDVASMSASPGTDQITVSIAFAVPAQGAIKLNWSAL